MGAVNNIKVQHHKLETDKEKAIEKEANGDSADDPEKKDEKKEISKLSKCERIMLLPFLVMLGIPSVALSLPLSIAAVFVWPFTHCTYKAQHATDVVELMASCNFFHRISRIVFITLLWPTYIICFVGAHTNMRGVVNSVGLGGCLELLGRVVYGIMFPSFEDVEPEDEEFYCDHPLCKFHTLEKIRLLRHHRSCEFARPFKCSHCGYRAAEENHIRAHELETHTADPDEVESKDDHIIDSSFGDIHEISVFSSSDEMDILESSDDEEKAFREFQKFQNKNKKSKKSKKSKRKSKSKKKSKKKKKKKKKNKSSGDEGLDHSLGQGEE